MPLGQNFVTAQEDTKIGRSILSPTPIAQKPASGIYKWNYMKLKCFWTEKKLSVEPIELEIIFMNCNFRMRASTHKLQRSVKSKYQ